MPRFARYHARMMAILALLGVMARPGVGQSISVPFRYTDTASITSVTVPGTFNGWQTSGPSTMQRIDSLGQWLRVQNLSAGETVQYKFFVTTSAGSSWVTDPNNPRSNPADNNNSMLTVADPSIFQPMVRTGENGLVTHFSAGILTSGAVQSVSLSVGGTDARDVTAGFDTSSRVLQVALQFPVVEGTRFDLSVVTGTGEVTASIGTLTSPLAITTTSRRTTASTFRLRGVATSATGQVDPSLTSVRLLRDGVFVRDLAVADGQFDDIVDLEPGENWFSVTASIDGVLMESQPVALTRWDGPLAERWFTLSVSGDNRSFSIEAAETAGSPGISSLTWTPDAQLSTASWSSFSGGGSGASGVAEGAGDIFVDVEASATDGRTQRARAAVRIAADGAVAGFDWADKASWIDQAVVYEIFPLSFGPVEATGTTGDEGNRFNEIRASLEYIRDMGFNTIWFMPIMRNVSMSQIGGGYSIIDFRTVDPKLGTNEDFKALVDRAHELGLRIVLDITINHVAPGHPWVQSLVDGGDYPEFIQTAPSPHNRGEDSRGASLPEQSSSNGLYRVYDGFGDLANLNWDNDDVQAEMLDILRFWLTEFDVDGFRFDAYWGPWRRYGPDRFGLPVREIMRHVRPDAWALGEIEGVGENTEVYYADDDNGRSFAGGLDSGYDWTYSAYLRNPLYYARTDDYRTRMTNYGFVPGPNARWFRFLENHDETRIQEIHRSNPDRVRPLTGLLLTGPGIPMIFQGQEVGYGAGNGDRRRLPVNWTTTGNDEWARWHRLWATARSRFPAFGTQEVTFLSAPTAAMAFVRPLMDENALVLINFAGSAQTLTVDPSDAVRMTTDGPIPYYNLAADTSRSYLDAFQVTLDPYEVAIYITDEDAGLDLGPLPQLPFGAVYTGTDGEATLPPATLLQAPWPNPARGMVRLEWHQDEAAAVTLALYDMLGRRVQVVEDGVRGPGVHLLDMDTSRLSAGVYHIRLVAGSDVATRSLVVLP